ncbi:hypothetical protein ERO13_D05G357766v2 [Gossypium hirsutum]|uniref:S-protein homolog n=4 Tax=Gossypium TaxID=3633 RepID=A0A1U8MZ01_GOSHI|nr:S-protein homolog 1-like [Gossypium hirsutum]KAG4149842.1 hypothetical protein ERO13_D05G357766v2 [Gossypium hirsutum]TYG71777.1 hypothetical protein ES288_D05G425800v1 [Gossypium darwinii]TYH74652.1 hypothetical protein ES332_D05G415800v1 [Gossypium tomentosum]TYI85000.1 hypothetical protein E1A91_D05G407400v1 [Gossypium mustelinum]
MNNFYKNVLCFILVQAIAITSLITLSSSEPNKGGHDNSRWIHPWFKTWHIYAVNELSKDQTLLVHCKSKDDDLGIHNLTVGSEFTWKFRPRFFGGTLFWCYMAYDNLHASFKAFWDDQALYNVCDWGTCFWIAKDDGIYIRNIPKNRDDYYCNWEQGGL